GGGHADVESELVLAEGERDEELLQQHIAGMRRHALDLPPVLWPSDGHISSKITLVIIHDLDFVRPIVPPLEADATLVIDPDTVLTLSVSFEQFQAIGRGDTQILQRFCGLQLIQFSQRHLRNVGKASALSLCEQLRGLDVPEAD